MGKEQQQSQTRPLRSVNLIFSGAVAWMLYQFFHAFAVSHFGAGPMGTYPVYLMILGNFMLALTFPLYVVLSVFFDGWPLPATPAPEGGEPAA